MRILGTSAYIPELLIRAPEVILLYADGPNGPKLLDGDPDSLARALVASATDTGTRYAPSLRPARCAVGNWLASPLRMSWACSTSSTCARR